MTVGAVGIKNIAPLAVAVVLAACATVHDAARPEPQPPIVEPEPMPSSLVVRLEDYAECFVKLTAEALQGRLRIGECPE